MSNRLIRYRDDLRSWGNLLFEEQWLTQEELLLLEGAELESADTLFANTKLTPLLIAFFGGTGVGKSSLLNRLAGEKLAKVGIVRPTSHEVTLYLHNTQNITALPSGCPADKTAVFHHSNKNYQDVVWLDMPDIDSVERENQALVKAWLPYVDWVIYVVSPDRYKDDMGWRELLDRSAKHHWLFIMNQFDLGRVEQVDDFRKSLVSTQLEAFSDPIILKTICSENIKSSEDDFEKLEGIIQKSLKEHGLEQIKQLGIFAKMKELDSITEGYQLRLGSQAQWDKFDIIVDEKLVFLRNKLQTQMKTHAKMLAQEFNVVDRKSWWIYSNSINNASVFDIVRSMPTKIAELWEDRVINQLSSFNDQLLVHAAKTELAIAPLAPQLESLTQSNARDLIEMVVDNIQDGISRPGNWFVRALRGLFYFLSFLLPLASASWAGWHLFNRFYHGVHGEGEFLGVEFVLHSLMLIVIAWLIPAILYKLMEPSIVKSIERSIQNGIVVGMNEIERNIRNNVRKLYARSRQLLKERPQSNDS